MVVLQVSREENSWKSVTFKQFKDGAVQSPRRRCREKTRRLPTNPWGNTFKDVKLPTKNDGHCECRNVWAVKTPATGWSWKNLKEFFPSINRTQRWGRLDESHHKRWFSVCSIMVSFMNIQFNLAEMVQRPRLLLSWGCIFLPGYQNCYYLDSRLYHLTLVLKILHNVYKYTFFKMSYTYMCVCVSIIFF